MLSDHRLHQLVSTAQAPHKERRPVAMAGVWRKAGRAAEPWTVHAHWSSTLGLLVRVCTPPI